MNLRSATVVFLSPNWQGLEGATDIVGDNTMRLVTNPV